MFGLSQHNFKRPIKVKCQYCKEDGHSSRNCPLENLVRPYMRKIVGTHMETFVADELVCPRCCMKSLQCLGNHAPSLDVICINCKTNFEVKSKCISATDIYSDLILKHGNYFDYINRQLNGLDFIIIIYGVNRDTKIINIRKVLHVPSEMTRYEKLFNVKKNDTSTASTIYIPNYTSLNEIKMNKQIGYDFSHNIKEILATPYDHTVPIILA